MKQVLTMLPRVFRDEEGASVVEYAVVLALIIAGLIIIIAVLGGRIQKGLADFIAAYETAKSGS